MTSHSIYGGIFITLLIKGNVFLLPVKIQMKNWRCFMACVALPGWDVGWLIWETDKSSVTLSLELSYVLFSDGGGLLSNGESFLSRKRCGRRCPETPWNKSAVMAGFAVKLGDYHVASLLHLLQLGLLSVYPRCTSNLIISTVFFSTAVWCSWVHCISILPVRDVIEISAIAAARLSDNWAISDVCFFFLVVGIRWKIILQCVRK